MDFFDLSSLALVHCQHSDVLLPAHIAFFGENIEDLRSDVTFFPIEHLEKDDTDLVRFFDTEERCRSRIGRRVPYIRYDAMVSY